MFAPYITDRFCCHMYSVPALRNLTPPHQHELCCTDVDELISHRGHGRWANPSNYDLHICHKGRGVLECEKETYNICGGDLFCLFPGGHYHYHDFPDSPWHYRRIGLAGSRALEILGSLDITPATPHHHGDFHRALLPCYMEAAQAFAVPNPSVAAACRIAWMCVEAIECLPSKESTDGDNVETRAKALIDNQFARALTIDLLANELQVSRTTIYLRFKTRFGLSPKEYLDKTRLDHACKLLAESRRSMKEIAMLCGYSSPSYFNQAFRRHCGVPPTQWRARQGEGR